MPQFNIKKILILVTILAVPGFLYYLLQNKGKNRYHPLAIYGPKQLASTFHIKRGKQIPDTIYHTIEDFQLADQSGNIFTFPGDDPRITVANFFFSRCSGFCKHMNKEMERVVNTYSKNHLLQFISITVDPEFDTPAILQKYSRPYNNFTAWKFLTGDKEKIYQLAKEDFLADAIKDTTQQVNFIHSPMLILSDSKKRIRGYYDSGSNEQMDKLIDEIKVLITEELRNIKDGR